MNAHIPSIRYKRSLASETEQLLAESALDLSESFPHIWKGGPALLVDTIELASLDRIGGEYGHGGSRVFVAAFNGKDAHGNIIASMPLLAKIVEDNTSQANKLLAEQERYKGIGNLLVHRHHAAPLEVYPSDRKNLSTRILWSEFLDESVAQGLPSQSPRELRHRIEGGEWDNATDCLAATYKILRRAHQCSTCEHIALFPHYSPYLRLERGWQQKLAASIGSDQSIKVLGLLVRNPLMTLEFVQRNLAHCHGICSLSAVHGDLHPRNVIVGDIQRAALIDFGWTQRSFHTMVDFVLMETSLKFFYLPWSLRRRELIAAESALSTEFMPIPTVSDEWLAGALRLLQVVRQNADHYLIKSDEHWFVKQYLLPLFLITMGTFNFAAKVTNLEYLLLSAGLLAEQIEKEFPS
jgi:hypothetical protein